ncbi:MAG: VOC family protein [Chloroflexota bacterium]|nr:VOC family protein [Chloroflexota bacterium]
MERAQDFYSKLFGWQFQSPPGMTAYWTFGTGAETGVTGGGMMARQQPGHGITNYIGVENLDESVAQVTALGGQVMIPRQAVSGMGYFAWCADSEGNQFAMWQDDESAA